MRTFECKIKDPEAISFLRSMNRYFGWCLRSLYVLLYVKPIDDKNYLKRMFCGEFGCSSTHYNSIKKSLDGLMDSRSELLIDEMKATSERIRQTKTTIKKLEKKLTAHRESISRVKNYHKEMLIYKIKTHLKIKYKKPRKLTRAIDRVSILEQRSSIRDLKFRTHQKRRRLAILESKHLKQITTKQTGRYSVCFGSKALLKKQNFLEENGYSDFSEWKEDWIFRRSNQSFWLGDSTEKGRNRNAKLDLEAGTIRLTVPEKIREKYGSFFTIQGLDFDSRAKRALESALNPPKGEKTSPLSYRILERQKVVHDKDGHAIKIKNLYLQVSVEEAKAPFTTKKDKGAIAVDLNVNHMAVSEINHHGNPIEAFNLYFNMEGKTSDQVSGIFGDHIADIVQYAKRKGKPLVIENLDFRRKKSALRETCGPRMARLLSSFSYSKFNSFITSRCQREGVELIKVNPAYSSILGALNYFGLSHKYTSHQMAGFVLARRGLKFKDSLNSIYNERNHTAFLQTVSIDAEKAPPTYDAWIKGGGKKHRWSLLRRYYNFYSHFVRYLSARPPTQTFRRAEDKRRNDLLGPLRHMASV